MEKQTQADFSLGLWDVAHSDMLQPRASLGVLSDGYVGDTGEVRCRGRVGQRVAVALSGPGLFVWAGALLPGRRELCADAFALSVLDAAGTAIARVYPHPLGGASVKVEQPAVVANTVVIPFTFFNPGPGLGFALYGGSRFANTNLSVSVVNGSAVITRAAGGFIAGVDAGMIVVFTGGIGWAVVKTVDTDTQVTLDRPWAAATNAALALGFSGSLVSWSGFFPIPGLQGPGVVSVAGRVVFMRDNVLTFSEGPDPATGAPRTNTMTARNRHEFPIDATYLALAALRDSVFVFTAAGVFIVRNMAYEIVDGSGNPAHPIEVLSTQTVALGSSGIVTWGNALIVPCRDGIYAIDGIGAPVKISRGLPIAEMVRDGLELGLATIFKGRYILPYRHGGVTRTWVLRLDAKGSEQGDIFPAARFVVPGLPMAYAKSGTDSLLAVGDVASGVIEAGGIFTAGTTGLDFSGSRPGEAFVMRTAPISLGDKAVVRRVRVRVTFSGFTVPAPTLEVIVRAGAASVTGTVEINAVPGTTKWLAVDLPAALEASVVTVEVGLGVAQPSDFIVHAVEVQYRAFGGR